MTNDGTIQAEQQQLQAQTLAAMRLRINRLESQVSMLQAQVNKLLALQEMIEDLLPVEVKHD